MNILKLFIFLLAVPYVQMFLLNPLSPAFFPAISPSLFIASIVLVFLRMPAPLGYIYAFLLGAISSILCGHPLAFDSISFLLIVYGVEKFSENFDLSGFGGQFVLGAAASVFHFFFIFFFSHVLLVNVPSLTGLLPRAALTGLLLALLFNTVLMPRSRPR